MCVAWLHSGLRADHWPDAICDSSSQRGGIDCRSHSFYLFRKRGSRIHAWHSDGKFAHGFERSHAFAARKEKCGVL